MLGLIAQASSYKNPNISITENNLEGKPLKIDDSILPLMHQLQASANNTLAQAATLLSNIPGTESAVLNEKIDYIKSDLANLSTKNTENQLSVEVKLTQLFKEISLKTNEMLGILMKERAKDNAKLFDLKKMMDLIKILEEKDKVDWKTNDPEFIPHQSSSVIPRLPDDDLSHKTVGKDLISHLLNRKYGKPGEKFHVYLEKNKFASDDSYYMTISSSSNKVLFHLDGPIFRKMAPYLAGTNSQNYRTLTIPISIPKNISLSKALKLYSYKLPETIAELKALREKTLSSDTQSLSETSQLEMARVQKLINSRNEMDQMASIIIAQVGNRNSSVIDRRYG